MRATILLRFLGVGILFLAIGSMTSAVDPGDCLSHNYTVYDGFCKDKPNLKLLCKDLTATKDGCNPSSILVDTFPVTMCLEGTLANLPGNNFLCIDATFPGPDNPDGSPGAPMVVQQDCYETQVCSATQAVDIAGMPWLCITFLPTTTTRVNKKATVSCTGLIPADPEVPPKTP